MAGGLELALWCDLRVTSPSARFGVFCRRFGVPLIDGGTVRLPRLIGASRAMDPDPYGPRSRPRGSPRHRPRQLSDPRTKPPCPAHCSSPKTSPPSRSSACARDRTSALNQWSLSEADALAAEFAGGLEVLKAGSARDGAARFSSGVAGTASSRRVQRTE